MKITLKAHIAEHREIAKMFGTVSSNIYDLFIVEIPIKGGDQNRVKYEDEITIDTSKAEMDLRLAIGTKIRFVEGSDLMDATIRGILQHLPLGANVFVQGVDGDEWLVTEKIQLSKDYLERIGVEYED